MATGEEERIGPHIESEMEESGERTVRSKKRRSYKTVMLRLVSAGRMEVTPAVVGPSPSARLGMTRKGYRVPFVSFVSLGAE